MQRNKSQYLDNVAMVMVPEYHPVMFSIVFLMIGICMLAMFASPDTLPKATFGAVCLGSLVLGYLSGGLFTLLKRRPTLKR